jgi:signal transduction histidine kinase/CheY-like chemotaxis protein
MIAAPLLPPEPAAARCIARMSGGLLARLRAAAMRRMAMRRPGPPAASAQIAALRSARDAAEAANEAKTRFLASVSHEIRSPLNAIYGYAQLLERSDGKDALHAARVIRRSAEHLSHLVEGLLDIAQVESGALSLARDTIRFPEFLEQLIEMMALQARAKGLALVLDKPPTGLPEFVHGDQKRLRQVLINLLSNAIKFTDRGAVRLEVRYRNDIATLVVIDSGIGIAAADIERIFVPFERVAGGGAGERSGAGLGLAITQALVRMMGGDLKVESTPGVGSRFTVQMMLSQPFAPPVATPAPAPGAVSGYRGRERWVLLIDDDPAHLAMVAGLLEPLGFQVRTARDHETALALAVQMQPDLVLCDVALAGESGWEIAQQLRRRQGPALRIVMLSGEVPPARAAGGAGPANDMFVMKPFDFTALLDVVAAQLGLEWVRAVDAAPPAPGGDPVSADPPVLDEVARAHLDEIGRLVRTGHVRAIEREIDALAGRGPDAAALAERLRACLDSFDLAALARFAGMAAQHDR